MTTQEIETIIANAFKMPGLASQIEGTIAAHMRRAEAKQPRAGSLPDMTKNNGLPNGRQAAILTVMADGQSRTLRDIGDGLGEVNLDVLHSAVKRAADVGMLNYTITARRKFLYTISAKGIDALARLEAAE